MKAKPWGHWSLAAGDRVSCKSHATISFAARYENSESGIEGKISGSNVSRYETLVFSTNAKLRRTFDPKIKSMTSMHPV